MMRDHGNCFRGESESPGQSSRARRAGHVLGMTLHVVLLLVILSQVVFLASRYRARLDLTSDGLYTLTDSTRRVIEGLEDRLVIEAYFSPDSTVPSAYRESRPNIRNFLDELVQVGKGKVILTYLDPQDDKELADKARILGIKAVNLQDRDQTSVSITELWQGLRLLYGAKKQKVIEFLNPQYSTPTQLEVLIIPAIKEVTLEGKAQIGFMEWQAEPARVLGNAMEEPPRGWYQMRVMPQLLPRYQFINLRYTDALVPDYVETLILFRPKDLTDREKYILDQFLMQGKTLVVFADSAEYELGQARRFTKRPFAYDAPDSNVKFLDQLAHYGIRVEEKLLADMHPSAKVPLGVRRVIGGAINIVGMYEIPSYPYFFRPVNYDWRQFAKELAGGDAQLRDNYLKLLTPGIAKGNALTDAMARVLTAPGGGPELFWACPVGLVDELPPNVTGQELLFTSPYTLIDDPPPVSVQPMSFRSSSAVQQQYYTQFYNRLQQRMNSEPRIQVPVMAEVSGRFTSFFEAKEIPLAFGEVQPVRVSADPLDAPIKDDPVEEPDRGDPEVQATGTEATDKEATDRATTEVGAGEAAAQDPGQALDPEGTLPGPPRPPELPEEDLDREPAPLFEAVKDGRIVVVGDSDFLRDDLVGTLGRGPAYLQIGGPVSRTGRIFFLTLLDWLYQEEDLNDVYGQNLTIRVLSFGEQDVQTERPEDFRQRIVTKTSILRWLNILLPPLLLLAFGAILSLKRHAQKRSFLASVES